MQQPAMLVSGTSRKGSCARKMGLSLGRRTKERAHKAKHNFILRSGRYRSIFNGSPTGLVEARREEA
jgi:hypothetical protein